MPTVSRQVASLVERALLRDAQELIPSGAVGRPRVPVDINTDVLAACGLHVGVTTTTYALADLRGGLLGSERISTPEGTPTDVLSHIAGRVRAFLRRWRTRDVIGVGMATGGQVDPKDGVVDHEHLGWHAVPARKLLEHAMQLPVRLDGHVPAMANAELLFGPTTQSASMLYFYVRQVVGSAIAVRGQLHRGPANVGTIAHLPVGSGVRCPCGSRGCLETTIAEQSVVRDAARRGAIEEPSIRALHLAAQANEPTAIRVLRERARVIGHAVGLLRDIINPDVVVLGGQGVTDAPEYLDDVLDSFASTSKLGGTDLLRVTKFGPDIQAIAACTSLLARVYESPFTTPALPNDQ